MNKIFAYYEYAKNNHYQNRISDIIKETGGGKLFEECLHKLSLKETP
jgi:dissimilatory sulfite reductase (desulfoviridin) alpha/beta subunit